MTSKLTRVLLAHCCGLAFSALVQAQETAPTILIEGGDEALQLNIRAHLQSFTEPCATPLVRLQALQSRVLKAVTTASQALGYYESHATALFSQAGECWQLTITQEPGTRLRLNKVSLEVVGAEHEQAVFAPTIASFKGSLSPGMGLHQGEYEALKSALTTYATDKGYFAARFDSAEIALNLVEHTADIHLPFNPGVQFKLGEITIKHDEKIEDRLINNLVTITQGDLYDGQAFVNTRRNLDQSHYFSQISVTPQLQQRDGESVPVTINLGMRPQHAYSASIGFTTDTGPRARLAYENRYLNHAGHKLLSDLTVSKVQTDAEGSYIIPLKDAARQSLTLSSGLIRETNDSFISERLKLEAALKNETLNGWQQRAFIDFQTDSYQVGLQDDSSFLTLPGVSLSKTKADNLINPSKGWKLFGQLRGASNALLSDTTLLQFYGSAKYIVSAGRWRLLSRAELGSTWISEISTLPASLRYFAGGDQSIRGYDFQSLGPTDNTGKVIGGRNLLIGSIEADFAIRKNWRMAVFTDAGNAFDNPNDLTFKQSIGIGIRWRSPVGPVRLDLAHPLDGEQGIKLHITMGPDL